MLLESQDGSSLFPSDDAELAERNRKLCEGVIDL
jgi:hypothetical protein